MRAEWKVCILIVRLKFCKYNQWSHSFQCFHVTCAQAEGLLCEEGGGSKNVKYCGYCASHAKKAVCVCYVQLSIRRFQYKWTVGGFRFVGFIFSIVYLWMISSFVGKNIKKQLREHGVSVEHYRLGLLILIGFGNRKESKHPPFPCYRHPQHLVWLEQQKKQHNRHFYTKGCWGSERMGGGKRLGAIAIAINRSVPSNLFAGGLLIVSGNIVPCRLSFPLPSSLHTLQPATWNNSLILILRISSLYALLSVGLVIRTDFLSVWHLAVFPYCYVGELVGVTWYLISPCSKYSLSFPRVFFYRPSSAASSHCTLHRLVWDVVEKVAHCITAQYACILVRPNFKLTVAHEVFRQIFAPDMVVFSSQKFLLLETGSLCLNTLFLISHPIWEVDLGWRKNKQWLFRIVCMLTNFAAIRNVHSKSVEVARSGKRSPENAAHKASTCFELYASLWTLSMRLACFACTRIKKLYTLVNSVLCDRTLGFSCWTFGAGFCSLNSNSGHFRFCLTASSSDSVLIYSLIFLLIHNAGAPVFWSVPDFFFTRLRIICICAVEVVLKFCV